MQVILKSGNCGSNTWEVSEIHVCLRSSNVPNGALLRSLRDWSLPAPCCLRYCRPEADLQAPVSVRSPLGWQWVPTLTLPKPSLEILPSWVWLETNCTPGAICWPYVPQDVAHPTFYDHYFPSPPTVPHPVSLKRCCLRLSQ